MLYEVITLPAPAAASLAGAGGGRPGRYFRLAAEGQTGLARSRSTLLALWEGLEGALDR